MIRLALRVRSSEAELVLAELLELAQSGVEEIDDGEIVEYAIYGAPGELPELPQLEACIGGALVEVRSSELSDDWQERWKRFHKPVTLQGPAAGSVGVSVGGSVDGSAGGSVGGSVGGLYVRPPWEPAAGDPLLHEIVIDPGQAFGTGSHATTKLCLTLLLELASSGERGALIDVGTGSGVLAIAASKLGFRPVLACDHDPESVRAANENASVNGVEIEVLRLDLRTDPLPALPGAVVLANLLRPLLLDLASQMPAPPPQMIASGLLTDEVDEVAGAFAAAHRMRERSRRTEGEWAALWLAAR